MFGKTIMSVERAARSLAVATFELRNISDIVALGAHGLFSAPSRFRTDGVVDAQGRRTFRLADALEARAYRPRVIEPGGESLPAGGLVFTDIILVVPTHQVLTDQMETGGEGLAMEVAALAAMIERRFGTRAWKRGRSARCAVLPSDALHDSVVALFGTMVTVPAADEHPIGRLRLGAGGNDLTEPTVLCPAQAQNRHRLIEKPLAVYPGQSRLAIAGSPLTAPVAVALPEWNGRLILDFERDSAMTAEGTMASREDSATGSIWRFDDIGVIIEMEREVAALPQVEQRPPPLPDRRLAVKGLLSLLGLGKQKERIEPRISVVPSGTGGAAKPASSSTGPGEITILPLISQRLDSPSRGRKSTIKAAAPLPAAHPVPETTILPAPPHAQEYTLELIGVALPRLDRSPQPPADVRGWSLIVTRDGKLIGDGTNDSQDRGIKDHAVALALGASRTDERLWARTPGQTKWRAAWTRGAADTVSSLPEGVRLTPSPVPERYHGLLLFNRPESSITGRRMSRQIFGRPSSGADLDEKICFPQIAPHALKLTAGRCVALDSLLSRRHLTMTLLHGQLHVGLLDGASPVWKLDADLKVVDSIVHEARGRDLVLADSHSFLVGCHVVRIRS